LKVARAEMLTCCTPAPAAAVPLNVQVVLATAEVWVAAKDPTSTHLVSIDVWTVNVIAAPPLA
jgi:hypothetical protein